MIRFAFFRPEEDNHELSYLGTIFYYGTNCFACPIAYSLLFLTIQVFIFMFNNMTSLESMSMRVSKIPCIGPVGEHHRFPNEYDMLWLPNLR